MIQGIGLGNIMIDCADQDKLCEFYEKLLGWDRSELYGLPGLRSKEGIVFLFITEEDYIAPIWPEQNGNQQKQMHFDFQVPDLPAAVQFAEELGAVRTKEQFGGADFVTMLDIAGHPFCLCAK